MSMNRELMEEARRHIHNGEYRQARIILQSVDHPKAREWLDRLDQMTGTQPTTSKQKPARSRTEATQAAASAPVDAKPAQTVTSKIDVIAVIALLLTAVAGGVGIGILLYLSTGIGYIIFGSIGLAAGLAGGMLVVAVYVMKVRAVTAVALIAIVMGLTLYGTYRVAYYVDFRNGFISAFDSAISEEIALNFPGATPAETQELIDFVLEEETGLRGQAGYDALVDRYLQEETGSTGFIGVLLIDLQDGLDISISRRRNALDDRDTGIPVSLPNWAEGVYWILEIIIAVAVPAYYAVQRAQQPFCDETDKWLTWKNLGQVKGETANRFQTALENGYFQEAGSLLARRAKGRGGVPIKVEVARCTPNSEVAQMKLTTVAGSRSEEILNTEISGVAATQLMQGAGVKA